RVPPAADRNRDVPGPHDRDARQPSGGAAEPPVDRAVRVDEVDALTSDQPRERDHDARVPRRGHGAGERLESRAAGTRMEAAVGLTGDNDAPPALARPPSLVEDADLLAPEAARRLRVEHRPHRPTASTTSRSTAAASIAVRHR